MARHTAHIKAIESWLEGSLGTQELLDTLRPHLPEFAAMLRRKYHIGEDEFWQRLPDAMPIARELQKVAPQVSCQSLLTRLRSALLSQGQAAAASSAPPDQVHVAGQEERAHLQVRHLPKRASRASADRATPNVPPEWLREPIDYEPPDLPLSVLDLAETFDNLSAVDRSLLRLLSLRVIGGWSLSEIAKRDKLSLDAVAEQWQRARHLINRDSIVAPISIVTLDLLEIHVLNTLLADPALRNQLDWRAFERLLAAILERFGYEIELRRGTKDGGTDIIAVKRQSDFGVHRYILQAKRWSASVGIEPVRELLFLRQHLGATKACLATTSTFTSGAWKLANEYQWCLELRDYTKLHDWIHQAFPFLPRV